VPTLQWEPCAVALGPGLCRARIHGHPVDGGHRSHDITVRYPAAVGPIQFARHPGRTSVAIVNEDHVLHQAGTVSQLLHLLKVDGRLDPDACPGSLDCHVEYIGKTEQPWLPFRNRLLRHHRLPDLQRHLALLTPQRELRVLLAGIGGVSGIGLDGSPEPLDAPMRMDDISPEALTEYGLHSHVVAAIEAALITYFMPRWNGPYKGTFPAQRHRSYRWVRERGLDAIGVELHREGMPALSSAVRAARVIHATQVHLDGPDGYPVLGADGYVQSDQELSNWLDDDLPGSSARNSGGRRSVDHLVRLLMR
jgi:hypothetical protein